MALWSDKMIKACLDGRATIEVHSPHTPEKVVQILSEQIYPYSGLAEGMSSPNYKAIHRSAVMGSVSMERIELRAGLEPRSSLIVVGTINRTDTGSTIEIELREPEIPLFRLFSALTNRYRYDLEFILDWLKSWIQTDDVTEFPTIE